MEVATPPVKIIDIADDDNDDVRVLYATSKGNGTMTKRNLEVEIVASFCPKPSSSGIKKVMIDLSDDDIQILGPHSNPKFIDLDDPDDNFTCDICVDDKSMNEAFKIMGCTHSYCKQCMSRYVSSKLQENICQISCPVSGCNGVLEPYYCRSILPKEVFDRWGDTLCEQMILGSQKYYCPFKDCSALLLIDENDLVIKESECPECRRLFCARCKVPWHSGVVCEEFQKLHKDEREREDIQLMNLAKNKEWRRCPKCKIYVERNQGCAQMRCRCGCFFCYKCGGAVTTDHRCTTCGQL